MFPSPRTQPRLSGNHFQQDNTRQDKSRDHIFSSQPGSVFVCTITQINCLLPIHTIQNMGHFYEIQLKLGLLHTGTPFEEWSTSHAWMLVAYAFVSCVQSSWPFG